jgi:membrane dipeptidase
MWKFILKILLVLLVFYLLVIFFLPEIIDRSVNRIHQQPPYMVTADTQAFFDSLEFIADLHCDALLWKRDLNKRHKYGHVDIPRLIAGNVAFQAFTIVSKVPYGINFDSNDTDSDMLAGQTLASGRSPRAWLSPKGRALAQCNELRQFEQRSDGAFSIIYSADDLLEFMKKRATNRAVTAGFLGLEGLQALEADVRNVEVFYRAGVRMMAPVHFQDNELGGSAHGAAKGGLSEFGLQVLEKIATMNIILDVAHASTDMLDDIIRHYPKPVITSHTGVAGSCPSPRNLSDQHLKAIAGSGGLIGIALFEGAVCGIDARATAKAMKYTVDLVGAAHVALGSDYDGAIKAPFDITGLKLLVAAMLEEGLTREQVRLIMGENVKRFWLAQL